METVIFLVTFDSGYETTSIIDKETATTSEYWVEITDIQNPDNLKDKPISVNGITIDSDGIWIKEFDKWLAKQLGINKSELYSKL